jgi:hypothetical protein
VKVSRATFLKICGVAALGQGVHASSLIPAFAVSGVPLSAGPAAMPSVGRFLLEDATVHHFSPHVNSVFTIRSLAEGPMRLVLARVAEGPRTPGIEQFSLIFHGRPAAAVGHLAQTLHHPVLGAFDLFIAPVGRSSAQAAVYEACFSRHVSAAEHDDSTPRRTAPVEDQTCRMSS